MEDILQYLPMAATLVLLFAALMMIVPQPFIAFLTPGFYNDPERLSLTMLFMRSTVLIFVPGAFYANNVTANI